MVKLAVAKPLQAQFRLAPGSIPGRCILPSSRVWCGGGVNVFAWVEVEVLRFAGVGHVLGDTLPRSLPRRAENINVELGYWVTSKPNFAFM